MRTWLYTALCLGVPLLWGLVSARIFDWWQARRGPASRPQDSDSVDMYHI